MNNEMYVTVVGTPGMKKVGGRRAQLKQVCNLKKIHDRCQNVGWMHLAEEILQYLNLLTYVENEESGYIQVGSNMTGTDLCVNKPHCAAAVRP